MTPSSSPFVPIPPSLFLDFPLAFDLPPAAAAACRARGDDE
jgi:hypothetical protein